MKQLFVIMILLTAGLLWGQAPRLVVPIEHTEKKITSVAFSPDGKYVLTGSGSLSESDQGVKLWDLNGRRIQIFSDYSRVSSLAFSPNGEMALMGTWNGTAGLLELNSSRFTRRPEIRISSDSYGPIYSVAYSPDGNMILTSAGNKANLWDLDGRKIQTFSGHTDGVWSVAFSPDGKMVLTGSRDKTAKLWNLDGHEIQTFSGHESIVWSVAFSPDGKKVLSGSQDKTAKLWDLNGHEIQTFSGHSSIISSVSFSPDGKYILTSSYDKTAKLWDLNGRNILTFSGHGSEISSAVFSPDGKFVLTCSNDGLSGKSDGTLKLFDAVSGKELATLVEIDASDWVVTTPSGLFDASPGAMKIMYYVQGLEVIDLDQLKERYYEPGLLAKIMGFDKSELRNVAAFDQIALYPEIKASVEKDQLQIQLTERSGGLGKLSLFLNGKEVQEDINPKRLKTLSIDLNTFDKYYTNKENTIALRAYNKENWLKSQAYELLYLPAKAKGKAQSGTTTSMPGPITLPHFYALVVGTSNYAGDPLDLRFADQDAESMASALKSVCTAMLGANHTHVWLLSTLPAEARSAQEGEISDKTHIQQAFQDIAAKATPADVLVVYFSGHGLAYGDAEKAQFYYLTKDIRSEDLSDPGVRKNYTISSDEFTQWLTAIPAQKQVMILDACNAGKVVESLSASVQKTLSPSQIRALDRMKDRTGMFILAGSAADKVSFEASPYGHGLLTYSLLRGMSGLALTDDKRVDVMKLFQYSRDQVPELAQGIGGVQVPVLDFPTDGSSFDIGIVDASVNIPLPPAKPVFIRNNFQDENYGDALHLVKALEDRLREISVKGVQAEFSYYDVSEYEKGYSIRGSYAYEGASVNVKGGLFKGDALQGKFQVTGKKNDVPGLVQLILDKVKPLAK